MKRKDVCKLNELSKLSRELGHLAGATGTDLVDPVTQVRVDELKARIQEIYDECEKLED